MNNECESANLQLKMVVDWANSYSDMAIYQVQIFQYCQWASFH